MRFTRRQMILGLLGAGTARLVPGCRPSSESISKAPAGLAPDRQRALAAAVERVLPGAQDAGVPDFLNYWLIREPYSQAPDWMPLLNIGAVHLDRLARREYRRVFSSCKPEQQDAILKVFQQDQVKAKNFSGLAFFQRLVVLTLEGFLSEPKYGGNRYQAGWRFIGKNPCWWAPKRVRSFLIPDRGFHARG